MRASWEKPFNSLNTRKGDFYVDEETTVKVPMMNKVSWFETYHDKILSCKVVKLPYKSNVSALFILPHQGKMKQLENALSKDVLLKWRNSTKSQIDQADLSEIPGKREVKISKAIHKAYLNVYENGTEAAATTATEIVPISLPRVIITFNRPFRFVMTSEFNPIFMAKVTNPTEA
ncbi:Hypothetical predicted protein [Podarcis lilfordi]|uniref:Serpin domain-containing protein n=1 Tax=Podarcis lilfordi TaxID=74358 RepID=A0AA35JSV8_9SAUR|nr:Hypothetical predicted protein [Podarcis lilfordi]